MSAAWSDQSLITHASEWDSKSDKNCGESYMEILDSLSESPDTYIIGLVLFKSFFQLISCFLGDKFWKYIFCVYCFYKYNNFLAFA